MLLTCVEAVHRSRDHGLWDGAGNWKKHFIGMEHQVFDGVLARFQAAGAALWWRLSSMNSSKVEMSCFQAAGAALWSRGSNRKSEGGGIH